MDDLSWLALRGVSHSENTEIPHVPPLLSTASWRDPLFQDAPVGVLYAGLDGGVLSANPEFCRLLGYQVSQLRRRDLQSLSHPNDWAKVLWLIQCVCQGERHRSSMDLRLRHENGNFFWTEAVISISGHPEDEDSYLLFFVTDIRDRQRITRELQQHREREALFTELSAQLQSPLDLEIVLESTVHRLRQALDTDRVLAYQLFPDESGICLAESVDALYPSMKGQQFPPECIPPPYLESYRQGRLWSVVDLSQSALADCHRQMLKQVQVQSMVAVGIHRADQMVDLQQPVLWGLLVVHHCDESRTWTEEELQLIQVVGNQMAIAIQQNTLLQQLQSYAQVLEERVEQRTQSLGRALKFEHLIRTLTETLRTDLEEDQVLQVAVEGLVQTLKVDVCYASLCTSQADILEVRYEYFREVFQRPASLVGRQFPITVWPEEYRQPLLLGQTLSHQLSLDQTVYLHESKHLWESSSGPVPQVAKIMSPIMDDQGLIGVLSLFQLYPRTYDGDEINLVQQVSSQCAIAIRQARLYRQEHEARISADYFRLFLEKSSDVFVEYDRHLRYLSINPAGCALLNRPMAAILGQTNEQILGPVAQPLDDLLRQTIDTGEPVFVDHELPLPTGYRLFETIYTPITDLNGSVQRIIGICRDITEVRQQWQLLERQNQQLAETTRLKEEFIATTSHELRTPLTAILGFSNVLLQEFTGKLNEKQYDYVERIYQSGQHLLALINDILDLSRIEAHRLELEPQMIPVLEVCESVVSLVQEQIEQRGLQLQVERSPDIEWLVADPRRLKQMLLNLLTNAIKFTEKGTIGLKVFRTHRGIKGYTGETINFLVWDTGVGIAPEDQERLFSPFSQIDSSLSRHHQGTGLGLAITRKLAELHGGWVTLESQVNQGSQFTLSLPLYSSPQALMVRSVF